MLAKRLPWQQTLEVAYVGNHADHDLLVADEMEGGEGQRARRLEIAPQLELAVLRRVGKVGFDGGDVTVGAKVRQLPLRQSQVRRQRQLEVQRIDAELARHGGDGGRE